MNITEQYLEALKQIARLISGKQSVEELDIQIPPSMQEEVAA